MGSLINIKKNLNRTFKKNIVQSINKKTNPRVTSVQIQ